MRTAVDSNVLLDLFTGSARFGVVSREALDRALSEGALVACEVVWAEVRADFGAARLFEETMETLGVAFEANDAASAVLAGEAWQRYREGGGRRTALVPDFLVAAHAVAHADRLLTRDRGFAARFFRGLTIVDPSR